MTLVNRSILGFAAALLFAAPAWAENAMTGVWTIERADPAPWVEPDYKGDPKEIATYVGKRVEFTSNRIKAPALLNCPDPNFEMKDYSGDMIFQGSIWEKLQDVQKADDAATKLGFVTRPIKTLETGCEHSFDFHMADKDHAAFALDNMIYWMTRKTP